MQEMPWGCNLQQPRAGLAGSVTRYMERWAHAAPQFSCLLASSGWLQPPGSKSTVHCPGLCQTAVLSVQTEPRMSCVCKACYWQAHTEKAKRQCQEAQPQSPHMPTLSLHFFPTWRENTAAHKTVSTIYTFQASHLNVFHFYIQATPSDSGL